MPERKDEASFRRALRGIRKYHDLRKAAEQARTVLAAILSTGHNNSGPAPEDIEGAFWALDAVLNTAQELGES